MPGSRQCLSLCALLIFGWRRWQHRCWLQLLARQGDTALPRRTKMYLVHTSALDFLLLVAVMLDNRRCHDAMLGPSRALHCLAAHVILFGLQGLEETSAIASILYRCAGRYLLPLISGGIRILGFVACVPPYLSFVGTTLRHTAPMRKEMDCFSNYLTLLC